MHFHRGEEAEVKAEEARWRRSLSANQSFSKHKREGLVVREKERKEAR